MACGNCGTALCGCPNVVTPRGARGYNGLSAYQVAVAGGFVGSESAWLASLNGTNGTNGSTWYPTVGPPSNLLGADGDLAYDATSTPGSMVIYLRTAGVWGVSQTLVAPPGTDGNDGADGLQGTQWYVGAGVPGIVPSPIPGPFYYLNNLTGDVYSWTFNGPWSASPVANLQGPAGMGTPGLSAYQVAVNNGFVGSEAAWLATLVGPAGPRGTRTGFGPEDPNTLPLTGWQDGDVWCQTNVAGQVTYWQLTSGVWSVVYTLVASGGVVLQPYLFRASKTVDQAMPTGGAPGTPTLITFDDDSTGPNFDASNSWNSFSQTLPANVTGITYLLENLTISRASGTQNVPFFTVDIFKRVSGVDTVLVTANLTMGLSMSNTLAVLQTAAISLNTGDQVRVHITPSLILADNFTVNLGSTFRNYD